MHDIMGRDVARRVSGWSLLCHAIQCNAQTTWRRNVKFGVLVGNRYFYLLTKFHLPEIMHFDVTLHVVKSCDVTHKGCLGIIKSNTIY